MDELLEDLKVEFCENLKDSIEFLIEHLEKSTHNNENSWREFKGELHSLKGSARSVEYLLCSSISHALENYIAHFKIDSDLNQTNVAYMYEFIDLLEPSLDLSKEVEVCEALKDLEGKLLKSGASKSIIEEDEEDLCSQFGVNSKLYPAKPNLSQSESKMVIEVGFDFIYKKIIEKATQEAEMKLSSVSNFEELMKLIDLGCRPDMVIAPFELPDVNGIELVKAMQDKSKATVIMSSEPVAAKFKDNIRPNAFVLKHPEVFRELDYLLRRCFSTKSSQQSNFKTNTVLIADDNPINLKVASKVIEKAGFEVLKAKDGLEALNVIKNNQLDFALLDLEMPRLSGLQVALRARDEGFQVPLFAFSAHEDGELKTAILRIAMDEWLSKPLKKDQLSEVLERFNLV